MSWKKKLPFLAGLAKGLVFARRPPIDESDVIFPFYGNAFNGIIKQFESTGGTVPELESVAAAELGLESVADDDALELSRLQAELLRDMAERLQYDAQNELSHSGQESVFPEGVSANDFLKIPYMTGALQFLSRKTSVSGLIIRRHLADVAYYVGRNEMREAVLDVVRTAVQENSAPGDDLVVLGRPTAAGTNGCACPPGRMDQRLRRARRRSPDSSAGAGVPATVRAPDRR